MKNNNNVTQKLTVLVQSDRLQLLYKQSYPAIFASIFAAALLTTALWPVQDHRILLAWFGLLSTTAILRLYLFRRYRIESPETNEVLRWEKPYFITLMLTTIIWGIGSLIILPPDSPLHQIAVFAFLIALAGGAVSQYVSHTVMTLATVAIVLLPATIYFLIYGEHVLVVMAVAAIVFFISSVRATLFLGRTLQDNFMLKHQLERSNRQAERLARIDDLTGLYNRMAFYENGKVLMDSCRRNKEDISMIHMDVDNFKIINDSHGHAAGDVVLKKIGEILLQRFRQSDVVARIGGEEFGILLPGTPLKQAVQLAEKLRDEISHTKFAIQDTTIDVSASFGVANGVSDVESIVKQADKLMYQSKESGRNRVTYPQG